MQKSIVTRKLIPYIIALFAVVLVAMAFGLANAFGASASDNKGEGNNAGDVNKTADIELILDVNGRDASHPSLSALNDEHYDRTNADNNDFENNNRQHLKVRKISASAVVQVYNAKNDPDKDEGSYHFVKSSIYYDCTEISVNIDTVNDDPTRLIVKAESKTRQQNGVRFSVVLEDAAGDRFPMYFRVVVEDTFAQHTDKSLGGITSNNDSVPMRVGGRVTTDINGNQTENNDSDFLVRINNYTVWQFELDEYLVNHALYINDKDDKNYTKPIRVAAGNDAPYWMISSVNNFTVLSVQFAGSGFTDFKANNPTKVEQHSASVSTTLSLSSDKIKAYVAEQKDVDKDYSIDKFWAETHDVQVTLATVEDNNVKEKQITVLIPVKFRSDNPQKTTIPSSYLNLTVTSKYICDYNNGSRSYKDADGIPVPLETIVSEGYSSIIIRPSDLVDYCFPSQMDGRTVRLTFDRSATDLGSESGDYMLVAEEYEDGMEMYPSAYRVIALKNNQYSINFGVRYYVEGSKDGYTTMIVLVSIRGDGAYTVVIPTIEGKDAVTYNVMSSSHFKQLRDANYIMTEAVSDNPDQLNVTLTNNELKLKPNVDKIESTTRATITMTFTNTNGQKLVLTSQEFGIDIDAGDWWGGLYGWQQGLFIAGMCILGIAIILLIVWLFIHSISKHRQAENATQAPVSSYIVKLNSSIAATQAQQRLAATQALSQASSQMLLGAGPTSTPAALPDTLQLASGIPSTPQSTMDGMPSEPSATMSAPKETEENYDELIAQYISDEELLERIFVEKYEPKGMVRRTFFKSKDLQARELEKEKKRIIERYKSPMPMDEAVMSESEANKTDAPATSTPQETEEFVPTEVFTLDFDPDSPLYVEPADDEFSAEKIDIDLSPEEIALKDAQHRNLIIEKEFAELMSRIEKVQQELDKNKSAEDILREKIAKVEADDEKYGKDIEDLEFKLASAKQKEKDRITRDINTAETKKSRNLDNLEKLRAELEALLGGGNRLGDIMISLNETHESKIGEQSAIAADLAKAQADYDAYRARLEKVRAKQELEAKLEGLNPMLVAVNTADYEIRNIGNDVEKLEKERESLKSEAATAKTQILSATDFDVINELNNRISDANARLSEIERELTKHAKRKSEINLDFTAQRRRANDYVEKNEIPLEELIAAEDFVVGNIELDSLRALREKDRETAESAVAAAQAEFDDVSASSTDITMVAVEIASEIQQLESDLQIAQQELDAINAQMETASEDEKLMLMVDQGDKSDRVEEIKQQIEHVNVEGSKRKIEAQAQYDERVETAHAKLDEVMNEFRTASAKYDVLVDTNPLDLIMSGCGVISQDQKKIEAANLKKQLEKSKNEIEQARLAAEMAQMEAEQARVDAARASDETKAEAERAVQEALEKAEAARLEAEEKSRSEIEAAEQARREAEEAVERAHREATEAAEASILEAEQAKREALEAAEQARREAEEYQERARSEIEEAMHAEAEEAKRKAQEEIDEMRRKAEEEAETKRLEEEKAKREEEERLKAESDRKDAIAAKVATRKEKIVVIRERMKDIKGDDDAKNLREQLYTLQLTFDEDEKGSVELMDFYNKTMDDIQHAGEVATLKAENAKKPKRIVRKVTERVNRIPKKKAKPGARPAARPGARPAGARRPSSGGARPAARPGARPAGARRPSSGGARRPSGSRPPRGR